MDYFTSAASNAWSQPYGTWFAGTYAKSITENVVASSVAVYTPTDTGSGSTSGGGQTSSYNGSQGLTSYQSEVRDGTGVSQSYSRTSFNSGTQLFLQDPSTRTEYVASYSDSSSSTPASTITVTLNVTNITSQRTEGATNDVDRTGDTGRTAQGSSANSFTEGTSNTNSADTFATTQTFTALTFPTGVGSSAGSVGFSTVTTTSTAVGGWSLGGISTASVSITRTTTGTPGTATGSTWVTSFTSSTFATSGGTRTGTAAITYSADFQSSGTSTQSISTTGTPSTTTTSALAFTATGTNHAWSPLEDTVCLMRGARDAGNYHLGNQLWVFSRDSVGASATAAGRFTDLFSSVSAASVTLSDFQKFATSSIAVTGITVSQNSTATTTATITGSTAGSGTNPASYATASTASTVGTVWKNGATWNEFTSYTSGTSALVSGASSNSSTVTISFNLGAVSTSLHTESAGPSSASSVVSDTHFYATIQETGYDSSGWTSTTATMGWSSFSTTDTRLALHSPATTTEMVGVRSTTADEILISSFASVSTNWYFVGLIKTSTTRVFRVMTPATRSTWDDLYNVEVDKFTTNSSISFSGVAGLNSTDYSLNEDLFRTYHSQQRVLPVTWSNPYQADGSPFYDHDVAWARGPAFGYGGPGGEFEQSSLPVYLSVTAGLAAGAAFSGQELATENLPTALAYSGVTFFPARTDYPISLGGAERAEYVSRLSSVGGAASVAVTWTSTTASGTSTLTTSRLATYTVAGVSAITGSFYRSEPIDFNTSDIRGGGFGFRGGFALGDDALSAARTVRINGGYVAWTAFNGAASVSSAISSATAGSVSFTVPGSLAIVLSVEPIISMSWGGGGNDHFVSSIPYFPT